MMIGFLNTMKLVFVLLLEVMIVRMMEVVG